MRFSRFFAFRCGIVVSSLLWVLGSLATAQTSPEAGGDAGNALPLSLVSSTVGTTAVVGEAEGKDASLPGTDTGNEPSESRSDPPHTDSHEEVVSDGQPRQGDSYVSFAVGGGLSRIEESDRIDDMRQWFHSFDFRFGKHFARKWRWDILHVNEGHPLNHHRDGFATQATYLISPLDDYRFEIGTGPYLSFDTSTDAAGVELNEKRWGLLSTIAVILPLPVANENFHLRLQLSNYFMHDRPNGTSVLAGVGFDLDRSLYVPREDLHSLKYAVWGSVVNTKINHGGPETTTGFSVDVARRFGRRFSVSLGYLDEGGDNGATDRKGLTFQFWTMIPLGKYFEGGIGFGPYVAKDPYEGDDYDIKGIITFGATYNPGWKGLENWYLGLSLSRVIDRFIDNEGREDDADVARLSVGVRF